MATYVKFRALESPGNAASGQGELGVKLPTALGPVYADGDKGVLETLLTGTNNDLRYTAKYGGAWSDNMAIVYVDPSAASQALSVSVSYAGTPPVPTITVSLATNGGSTITSTAALVAAAINAHPEASLLVDVTNKSGNDGTGVVTAMSSTVFTSRATLTTALTGSNNDLVYTAVDPGVEGNDITIAYINPGVSSASETVEVDGTDIVVNLSTAAGTNEVQTLTITGTPNGGDFTITVPVDAFGTDNPEEEETTATIAYNASAANVDSALELLASIPAGGVTCGGGALPGTPVTITFTGALAGTNVGLLVADGAGLTGGTTPDAAIATTTPGVVGAITSTGDTIKASIEAEEDAAALVTVADAAANDGSGVVTALAETALSGGDEGSNEEGGEPFFVTATSKVTAVVDIEDRKVQRILRRNAYRLISLGRVT